MSWKCVPSPKPDLITLGLDVCTGSCAVAVVEGEQVLASLSEPMQRGHVERLAPLTEQVLAGAGISPQSLDVIAVTTGPGSFTGARLGVAFARSLALAANAGAVGVTVFEAMARTSSAPVVIVALDGRRDDLFVQRFEAGLPSAKPQAAVPADAWRLTGGIGGYALMGSGSGAFLSHAPDEIRNAADLQDGSFGPEIVAKIGAAHAQLREMISPTPLYMRAPDAKPARPVA